MNKRAFKTVISTTATLGLLVMNVAFAQRNVIVNGQTLTGLQISQLEQMACTHVPDGNYWIDLSSGAWGHVGSAVRMGYVGEACQRRKSLSERRQLYRPGEILSE